jgi:Leucine-rich repeat (LRR) protein
VSKNTKLTELVCNSGVLTSLDLSNNPELTVLDCSSNELTVLDISKNTLLEELNCAHNLLSSLDISKNTSLTELDCFNNPGDGISTFPITTPEGNTGYPAVDNTSWTFNGATITIDYRKAD